MKKSSASKKARKTSRTTSKGILVKKAAETQPSKATAARSTQKRVSSRPRPKHASSSAEKSVHRLREDLESLLQAVIELKSEVKSLSNARRSNSRYLREVGEERAKAASEFKREIEELRAEVNSQCETQAKHGERLTALKGEIANTSRQAVGVATKMNEYLERMGQESQRGSGTMKSRMGLIVDSRPVPVDGNAAGHLSQKLPRYKP